MTLTKHEALSVLRLNNRNLTNEKIKTAYRKHALAHHPNKGGNRYIFGQGKNARNVLMNYIASHATPLPRAHLNKSVYKNFANEKNYATWMLLKKKLGRPLHINNINPVNNQAQKIRGMINFYTALNNKKNNAMLNYLYWSAFGTRRRNKTGMIILPQRHKINNIDRKRYGL